MVLFLSKSDIETVMRIEEAIEAVEKGFKEIGNNTALSPPRPYLNIARYGGGILLNMGYLEGAGYAGVKIASSYPNNKSLGLPTVASLITLHDPKTGLPIAVMEGGYLTALKTGAVGGVAAKYLSRTSSEVAGIIGAGVQARTQLWALCVVRKIAKAYVYSVNRSSSQKFSEEMSKLLGIDIHLSDTVKDLVVRSDIIVTATTSNVPVFKGTWLSEGVHITGIGSFTADAAEIDEESLKRAGKAFVDNWEALDVGDLRIALNAGAIAREKIYHLSDVVLGKINGRKDEREITIFKSVGGAAYDVAVSARAYELAKNKGVGKELEL